MPGTGIIEGAPSFVDAANGDCHLQHALLGVDGAPDDVAADIARDLDGAPRVVDLPGAPNEFGPLDPGAYEIQPACARGDTIFCDGSDGL